MVGNRDAMRCGGNDGETAVVGNGDAMRCGGIDGAQVVADVAWRGNSEIGCKENGEKLGHPVRMRPIRDFN